MKKLCVIACAVWSAGAVFADSVQFNETFTQSLKAYREEGEVFYEQVAGLSFNASGSLTLPGLSSNGLHTLENFSLSLGGFSMDEAVSDAASRSANRLVFNIRKEVETEEDIIFVTVGSVTLERSGNVLSFQMSAERLGEEFSIAAGNHTEPDEESPLAPRNVRDQTEFSLSLGEFSFARNLYYRGTANFRRERVGSGEFAETYTLATVNISGGADYARPTLTIGSPRSLQRISNEVLTVQGRASDNGEVTAVFVRVNNSDEQLDGGYDSETGIWATEVLLQPGTNTIEATCVDADENVSLPVRVRCVYVVTEALTLNVGPGGTVEGVAPGQLLELGRGYRAIARPGPTNLFSGWTSSATGSSTNPALNFIMSTGLVLEARFIPNPWVPNAGTYQGVFKPATGATPTNAGFLTLQLTAQGRVTGKLVQGAVSRPFTGKVGLDGSAVISVPGRPALTLALSFDLTNGSGAAEGMVSAPAWQSPLRAVRRAPVLELTGRHTFAIPGAPVDQAASRPVGDGAGVLTVTTGGVATATANLGDGTPFLLASSLSRNGEMPVHATPYGGRGLLIGWLNVSTQSSPFTVTGQDLTWFKPPGPLPRTYPAGFAEAKSLIGARYTPPPRGSNVLNWTAGAVLLDGGKLGATLSNAVTVAGARLSVLNNSNRIALTIVPGTGRVSGTFLHPTNRVVTPLHGVVLQMPAGDEARGWFIGNTESGYLDLRGLVP